MSRTAPDSRWTTPAGLKDRLRKRWDRGEFLSATVSTPDQPLFPMRIPLKGPTARELAEDFASVRDWAAAWRKQNAVDLEWRETNHRLFGQNALPVAAILTGMDDVVGILGTRAQWERFRALTETTRERQPALLQWLGRRPLQALDLAGDWDRLLAVTEWLRAHPRPGIYIRQMTVPGVHTKFVEVHRKVLSEWLDLTLPGEAIDPSARGAAGFVRRYGFREKPERIRIRFLDRECAPISERIGLDLTLDAAAFARFEPAVRRVFITENEINYLAFPDIPESLIVFGSGYGWSTLAEATWLHRCRVLYWGDIDTHGFAILDQLRRYLPHAESFLMDRATLDTFRDLWGEEPQPLRRDLPRLNAEERTLYDTLLAGDPAPRLRLEQERIAFSWLHGRLTDLAF